MASLQEIAQWSEGIYQLETTDPVMGGPDGIDNRQAGELANRTAYLRQMGVTEWLSTITYKHNSIVNSAGILYKSLDDNNVNNAVTDTTKWAVIFDTSGFVSSSTTGLGLNTSKAINIESWSDLVALKTGTLVYLNAASFVDWPLTVKYGVLKKIGSKIGASGDEPGSFYCEFTPYNSATVYYLFRETATGTVYIDGGLNKANLKWYSKAIGEIVTFSDFDVPPTNLPDCRYALLTINSTYNAGLFSEQNISGSSPLLYCWGKISLTGSPLNGQLLRFINNEQRYLLPHGQDSTTDPNLCRDDAIQNIVGTFQAGGIANAVFKNLSGPFSVTPTTNDQYTGQSEYYRAGGIVNFNAGNAVRTDKTTHGRDLFRKFYMRIL